MKLRILDVDGTVTVQPAFKALAAEGGAQVIDLRAEGDALRLWALRPDMLRFCRRLGEEGAPPGQGAEVTFVGSGDFHHLTAPLIARAPGPLTVVHFDNHPDWGKWPPAYHCGSWVNRVLEMGHVAKVVTIGPCDDRVTWPQAKGANLAALGGGKLELHPWRLAPSRVLGRGTIRWDNLDGRDWDGFLDDMVARLPTANVYVTIDKDVLDRQDAVTNWTQGRMRLGHILAALRKLAAGRRVVGVDVCGEYAPPRFPSRAKRLLARFDQPPPPCAPDLAINADTNLRLLRGLAEAGV